VLEFSAASQSSIVAPREDLAVIRHVRKGARLLRKANSQAALGPSIPHARRWVDLLAAQRVLRAPGLVSPHGLVLLLGPALARLAPARAEPRLPPRVRVRRARQTSVPEAAGSSTQRPRKAR